jgi:murein hydrolase activator
MRQCHQFSVFALGLLGLGLLIENDARAQTADPAVKQQELGTVEQEIKASAEIQAALALEIAAAIKAEDELAAKLVGLARTIQSQEKTLIKTETKLKNLNIEAIEIRSDLAEKQEVLSNLLAGLQRLEQNPPPALVVDPNDVLKALRGAMMFGAVVPDVRKQADLLLGKVTRLDQIRVNVDEEKTQLSAGLTALSKTQIEVKDLIKTKKTLTASQQQNLKIESARAESLAAKASSLKQLLRDIAAENAKIEAQKTVEAKAAEDEKLRQRNILSQPSLRLSEAKGKLDFPAQGQLLKRFGDDDGLGSSLQGIAIATRKTAQVIAPTDSKVEFAGPFRSYGQLLILDAGEGYLLLLAGMKSITASRGQSIKAGEPVGEMGDGPSSVTLLGDSIQDNRPILYVEFRKSGDPIDSKAWWIGAKQEASQ